MALPLSRWNTVPTAERLNACADLTMQLPMGSVPVQRVTLLIALPGLGLQRGQVMGLLKEEGDALILAGFAVAS